jgi:hypothetical protein
MNRIQRALRIVVACAAVGVVLTLGAVMISVIRAVGGTENHMSGDQLVVIFLIGAILALPVVLRRLSHKQSRKQDDAVDRQ